ncbi:MAG TPA: beta-L-arabinofuranosidase domain-containing protein, partial [Chloroflexota bacterium]
MPRTKFLLPALCLAASFSLSQTYLPDLQNRAMQVVPRIAPKAFAFPLSEVRLLESPFSRAMRLDAQYILSLEPDRLLHRFRLNAGLEPKGALYGGWEQETISGHTLGHYLSACALMYSATSDPRFKQRIDYVVDELTRCQDARGTGYVGGIPNEDTIFAQVARGEIRAAGFDLNGGWVPWYTMHKLLAGLLDAYIQSGNAKALGIASRLGDWVGRELKDLNDEQIQRMLACEHGGMNEALANLYAATGKSSYLELSRKFHHRAVLDSLARR